MKNMDFLRDVHFFFFFFYTPAAEARKKRRQPGGRRRRMRGMKDWGPRRRTGCHHQGGGGDGWVRSRTAKWTAMRHMSEGSEKEGWYFSREASSARERTHKHS